MRLTLPSIAILAVGAVAQSVADIPTCALPCFLVGINASGCNLTDQYCQCTTGKTIIQNDLTNCLLSTKPCNQTETIRIEPAANALCEKVTGQKAGAASSITSHGMGSVAVVVGVVSLMSLFGL